MAEQKRHKHMCLLAVFYSAMVGWAISISPTSSFFVFLLPADENVKLQSYFRFFCTDLPFNCNNDGTPPSSMGTV